MRSPMSPAATPLRKFARILVPVVVVGVPAYAISPSVPPENETEMDVPMGPQEPDIAALEALDAVADIEAAVPEATEAPTVGEPTPEVANEEAADAPPGQEIYAAWRWQPVYRKPDSKSRQRGLLLAGETFYVSGKVEGPGCKTSWGVLPEGGYTCLDKAVISELEPVMQPRLVAFDAPEPDEYRSYVDEGKYARAPSGEAEGLVPFVYGKRWRRWRAPFWSSAKAYEKGSAPAGELEEVTKFHVVEVVETSKGTLLKRADGTVTPADQVFVYPIDRFGGRDLSTDPVPDGQIAAWVVNYLGIGMREGPDLKLPQSETKLPYHAALSVDATPATEDGKWWRVPDGLGPGKDGFLMASPKGIRVWKPLPPPKQVSPDTLWVDVDTSEQVLALRKGEEALYLTLVSTGEGEEWATPHGLYNVYDKSVHGDMKSREDAEEDEAYNVERVPWVMHFRSRYALHGVFWHWGFGHEASHGCINLAPRDAKYLFDRIGPKIGHGWHTGYATPEEPGTLLRVRALSTKVPDLRSKVE